MGCIASTLRFFADDKLSSSAGARRRRDRRGLRQFAANYASRPLLGRDHRLVRHDQRPSTTSCAQAHGWRQGGHHRTGAGNCATPCSTPAASTRCACSGCRGAPGVIAGSVAILEAADALHRPHAGVRNGHARSAGDMLGRAEQRDPRHQHRRTGTPLRRRRHRRHSAWEPPRWRCSSRWRRHGTWTPRAEDWLALERRVHEIGLFISAQPAPRARGLHPHHSDLAGFGRQGQQVLATLLRKPTAPSRHRQHRHPAERLRPAPPAACALLLAPDRCCSQRRAVPTLCRRFAPAGRSTALENCACCRLPGCRSTL